MIRFPLSQFIEHQIYCIFEVFIILSCFGCVDHFQQGREVHFILRSLIPDISDQCLIIQFLGFYPEGFTGLVAFTFGIGDDRIDQLQDILFGMDIHERVVVHALLKVDEIQHFDLIFCLCQKIPAFD